MPKRIKTKKGNVVEFNDYISMLKNQYKMLIAKEKIDTAAVKKVQDTYYALLLWNGDADEINEKDLENVVKQNQSKEVDRRKFINAGNEIKAKESDLEKNLSVPNYLKKVWPYYYDTLNRNDQTLYSDRINGYDADRIINRANIISNMCEDILSLNDEDLVPKSEEEARSFILRKWPLLHAGAEITNVLNDLSCEYDIVDLEDYQKDQQDKQQGKKVEYRGYTCTEKVEKRKFPPKGPFLAALKHKQKLINNLLVYEKKWKAEADFSNMLDSDWEIVTYDEAPSAQYDNAKIYRHNFVQNEKGKIFAALQGADISVDDVLATVKDRLTFELMDKAYPDGLPEDVDPDAKMKELADTISDEQLYAEAIKYAEQVAVEEEDAGLRYKFGNTSKRYVIEIKEAGKRLDEFERGKRKIGDHEGGFSVNNKVVSFCQELLTLVPNERVITQLDAVTTAGILCKFAKLYSKNVDKLFPDKDAIERFQKLEKILEEIKNDAEKILDEEDLEQFKEEMDEGIAATKECIVLATARKNELVEKRRKKDEESIKEEQERIKESNERQEFANDKENREKAFAEKDEEFDKKYKDVGITSSELKEEARQDSERAYDAVRVLSKGQDIKVAQFWGNDPLRNSEDPMEWKTSTDPKVIAEKNKVMEEREKRITWESVRHDLEVAQLSILGLPAEEFPGNASAYENKLKFITNFLTDIDFKNRGDVQEFIEKAHITFEKVKSEALGDKPSPLGLMSMYGEAMQTIASLSIYNNDNPSIAPALHEATNTIEHYIDREYADFSKSIAKNNSEFSKEFIGAARYMKQSRELNYIQEKGLIAKNRILNNTCDSPGELRRMYASYMASKIASMVVSNDKKQCLSEGELQSPSLKLLGNEGFTERLVKGIQETKTFKELCEMKLEDVRECVMFADKPLVKMAQSILKDVAKTFKKSELDAAMSDARMTEKAGTSKVNKSNNKNKEALVPLH